MYAAILLTLGSVILAALGWLACPAPLQGVATIGLAIAFAVWARVAQAGAQHKERMEAADGKARRDGGA